jgi:hypothetical protein
MTLNEIKKAVRDGKQVHWASKIYKVINPIKSPTLDENDEQWLIHCTANNSYTGLTWQNNVTVNGKESEFFIA